MPIDDAKKRELVQGITQILRQSPLSGTLDTQRLAMAFSLVLDNVEEGQPIDLESLYQWLLEQKAPPKQALELTVVLKLREQKLGVQFQAPLKAQYLDQIVLDDIASRFQVQASERQQGYDKKPPEPLKGALPMPDAGWSPKKKADAARQARLQKLKKQALYGVLFACIAGGVSFWSWRLSIAKPRLKDAEFTDAAGLACAPLKANDSVGLCYMTRAAFESQPFEAQNTRAMVTQKWLKQEKGAGILYVVVDRKVKIRKP